MIAPEIDIETYKYIRIIQTSNLFGVYKIDTGEGRESDTNTNCILPLVQLTSILNSIYSI